MAKISTKTLEILPGWIDLRKICKSISAIEAIVCPEREYRYYTFQKDWSEEEEVCEMRNGQGDIMLALFRPDGACINGFAFESALNVWKRVDSEEDKSFLRKILGLCQKSKPELMQEVFPGMFDGLPPVFDEFIFGEPVKSIGTTFCIWQLTEDSSWKRGSLQLPSADFKDGSQELLRLLDGKAETYCEWANGYYEVELELEPIRQIFNGVRITKKIVEEINPHLEDFEKLKTDLAEIGYEFENS